MPFDGTVGAHPRGTREGGSTMMDFRRLLVPHDLSAHADEALRVAADLAGPDGDLLILHAVMPVMPMAYMTAVPAYVPLDEMIADAKRYLERVVASRIGRGGPKTTIKVVVGDPTLRIIEHTRDRDAVVMSTQGRTGLAHLVIGSVAEKTVRHSPIPVLTVRPRKHRRDARSNGSATRRRAA
jgi:nucleotide-binding universal stress UspA family protein